MAVLNIDGAEYCCNIYGISKKMNIENVLKMYYHI